jgi:hypothetical protein
MSNVINFTEYKAEHDARIAAREIEIDRMIKELDELHTKYIENKQETPCR